MKEKVEEWQRPVKKGLGADRKNLPFKEDHE